jgi:hypothetical protein
VVIGMLEMVCETSTSSTNQRTEARSSSGSTAVASSVSVVGQATSSGVTMLAIGASSRMAADRRSMRTVMSIVPVPQGNVRPMSRSAANMPK